LRAFFLWGVIFTYQILFFNIDNVGADVGAWFGMFCFSGWNRYIDCWWSWFRICFSVYWIRGVNFWCLWIVLVDLLLWFPLLRFHWIVIFQLLVCRCVGHFHELWILDTWQLDWLRCRRNLISSLKAGVQ